MKKFRNDKEIKVIKQIKYDNKIYCIYTYDDGWNELFITNKERIINEKDTHLYKQRIELGRIQREKDKEIQKIQDKAIKSLSGRLKLNSAFSSDNKMSVVGMQIVGELEKLIKPNDTK